MLLNDEDDKNSFVDSKGNVNGVLQRLQYNTPDDSTIMSIRYIYVTNKIKTSNI